MATIKLPQAGKTATDGTIVRWLKSPGDSVQPGDVLFVFETVEGLAEAEAAVAGPLTSILAQPGQTLRVGASVAEVGGSAPQPSSKSEKSAVKEKPMAADTAGVVPILMPQAGNSMEEGTILSWHVKEGDRVSVGDVMVEIETDKSTMEVEAQEDGRVSRIVAKEGDIIPVKEAIAYLSDDDATVDAIIGGASAPAASAPAPAAEPVAVADQPKPELISDVVPILMPQAGNSMEEGTILSWQVKEGDRVNAGDIVVEIETDKSTMEVEAHEAGRVARIVAKEGDIVPVKEAIAYLAENDADVDAFIEIGGGAAAAPPEPASVPKSPAPAVAPAAAPVQPAVKTDTGRVKASPAARKFAAEKQVDLASVGQGSGPYGRILSTDVESAAKSGVAAPRPTAPPARVTTGQPTRQTMSKMRRAIAKGLSYSKQNLPHWYLRATIDAGPLFRLYKGEKTKYQVSVNDFVVMACSKGLQEFPLMRSQIEGNDLVEYPNSNIGVAVGTDDGLVVPVIMGVEQMSLEQLGSESRRIALAARDGKVSNSGKGVFTISNLGMFGVEEFGAIINPPEAAILAVGAIREQVIVENGAMRPGRVMTMTLSSDHRIVDGTEAAKFMARLKEILQAPESLI